LTHLREDRKKRKEENTNRKEQFFHNLNSFSASNI